MFHQNKIYLVYINKINMASIFTNKLSYATLNNNLYNLSYNIKYKLHFKIFRIYNNNITTVAFL